MDAWADLLDEMIGEILANQKIFLLHVRNRSAFEQLHHEDHAAEHADLEALYRTLVSDTSIPLRTRIRIGCAVGALVGGLALSGDLLGGVPRETMQELLGEAVRDLLGVGSATRLPKMAQKPAKKAQKPVRAATPKKAPAQP